VVGCGGGGGWGGGEIVVPRPLASASLTGRGQKRLKTDKIAKDRQNPVSLLQ
jgi:hypothetical protein